MRFQAALGTAILAVGMMHPGPGALAGTPAAATPGAAPAPAAANLGPMAPYIYPGAEVISSGAGDRIKMATVTTPDPPEAVISFLEKSLGESLGVTCVHTGEKTTACANDTRMTSTQSGGSYQPVVVHVLAQFTRDHVLNITITRAPGEDATHIVLFYEVR